MVLSIVSLITGRWMLWILFHFFCNSFDRSHSKPNCMLSFSLHLLSHILLDDSLQHYVCSCSSLSYSVGMFRWLLATLIWLWLVFCITLVKMTTIYLVYLIFPDLFYLYISHTIRNLGSMYHWGIHKHLVLEGSCKSDLLHVKKTIKGACMKYDIHEQKIPKLS